MSAEMPYAYFGPKWLGVGYNAPYGAVNFGLLKKMPGGATWRVSLSDLFWNGIAKVTYYHPELNLNTGWMLRQIHVRYV